MAGHVQTVEETRAICYQVLQFIIFIQTLEFCFLCEIQKNLSKHDSMGDRMRHNVKYSFVYTRNIDRRHILWHHCNAMAILFVIQPKISVHLGPFDPYRT